MNEHVICLDVGDARTGIAVSDATRLIASPLEVMKRVGWGPDTRHILEICQRYDTKVIVSGLPLNMDGTEGFQAKKVKDFCAQLEKAGLTVYYQDERLTTVGAEDALLEGGLSRMDRKQNVDKVAAALILQEWLDAQRAQEKKAAQAAKEEITMDENKLNAPEMEEEDGIIELEDENGELTRFVLIAPVEYEGEMYLALMPEDEAENDDEESEVVLLHVEQDENGEEIYSSIEDDDLADAVFEAFLAMMDEEEE